MCQKNKVLHRIKFNQEIFTKLLKRMHQLSINLLCSSGYRTTCEIKHLVKQAKSLLIHFQGLLLKNITCVISSFFVLRVLSTTLFTDLIYHLWKRRYEQFYGSGYFLNLSQPGCWRLTLNNFLSFQNCQEIYAN